MFRGVRMNKKEFKLEMLYTLNRFDWGNSPLDARAIAFLNIWVKELDNLEENT